MSWNTLLGVACVITFALPAAVIIYNRFYSHRSLAALLVYYIIAVTDNALAQQLVPSSGTLIKNIGVLNNYLDVPLMLATLLFFCPNKQRQKSVHILCGVFLVYEIVIAFLFGFTAKAITYIMGPGLLIILVYALYLFIRQIKFTVLHGKNIGRTFMLAAIFFAYGSYALIYFFYYILKTPYKQETLLLYFISSIIASILMTIGLHMMRKRMKELAAIKITRKELAAFFGPDNIRQRTS